MRSAVIGFVLGVAFLQTQALLPAVWLLCGLLLLATLPAAAACKIRHPCFKSAANLLAGALSGIAWAALFAQYYLQRELPPAWEGRDITVIGTVDSLPSYFESGARFTFSVEKVLDQDGISPVVPKRLALAWYQTAGQPPPVQVQPGARWQLTVRLKRPHGNANPAAFDYEAWLLERNLRATGYVRSDQKLELKNQQLQAFVFSPGNLIEVLRSRLRERILQALPEHRYAGVLVALAVGDQRAIAQW